MKEWDTQPGDPWQELAAISFAHLGGQGFVVGALVETLERVWLPPRGTLTLHGSMGSQYVQEIELRPYIDRARPTAITGERHAMDWSWRTVGRMGEPGSTLEQVGRAWVVYYPRDRVATIWSCALDERHQAGEDAWLDENLIGLWQGVEGYLWTRFPDLKAIVVPRTPSGGMYEPEGWETFLRRRGYRTRNAGSVEKLRAQ